MKGRRVACRGSGDFHVKSALPETQKVKVSSHEHILDSILIPGASSSFLGSMVSFGGSVGLYKSDNSIVHSFDQENDGFKFLDEYFNQPEKKRRLSVVQVEFLERSFEAENTLEPERKIQLAKELGLQPRQIAVWFQNRRARWKTKQLEMDYETLEANYNSLKTDYDELLKENEKLQAEVVNLMGNKLVRDQGNGNLQLCGAKRLSEALQKEVIADAVSEDEESKASNVNFKCENIRPARSDVVDSPHVADGVHSSLIQSSDTSRAFEPDQSDLSQNDEENEALLRPACVLSKIEDADYPDLPANPCSFGFSIEDQAFGFWSY